MSDAAQQAVKNSLGIIVSIGVFIGGLTLQEWVLIATLVSVLIGGAHSAYKLARDIIRDRKAAKRPEPEPWL